MHEFKRIISGALMGAALMLCGLNVSNASEPSGSDMSAQEIAKRAALVDRVPAWKASVEIVDLANNQAQRRRLGELGSRQLTASTQGRRPDTQRYYRFQSPQDIRGTTLLIHEHAEAQDDIWLYLPVQGKSRRIAGSAKKNSFVGTQYAFVDLTSFEHDRYRHVLIGSEPCAERAVCWLIESTPVDDSYSQDIGYAKQRSWVNKKGYRIVKVEYYDMAGALLKTQVLGDYIEAGGDHALAQSRTMTNHRSGLSTSIRMSSTDLKPAFGDADFSPQRLGE
jgi:hypothetical protein